MAQFHGFSRDVLLVSSCTCLRFSVLLRWWLWLLFRIPCQRRLGSWEERAFVLLWRSVSFTSHLKGLMSFWVVAFSPGLQSSHFLTLNHWAARRGYFSHLSHGFLATYSVVLGYRWKGDSSIEPFDSPGIGGGVAPYTLCPLVALHWSEKETSAEWYVMPMRGGQNSGPSGFICC